MDHGACVVILRFVLLLRRLASCFCSALPSNRGCKPCRINSFLRFRFRYLEGTTTVRGRIIIESPYSGHVLRNAAYARTACAHALALGDAPFASHLLYTQPGILDDTLEDERALGIAAGLLWGSVADVTVVYIDLGISNGMKIGIKNARDSNRPVELRSIGFTITLQAGWTERLDECLVRAASVFGTGDAARYYREQEAIVERFQAVANAIAFRDALIRLAGRTKEAVSQLPRQSEPSRIKLRELP